MSKTAPPLPTGATPGHQIGTPVLQTWEVESPQTQQVLHGAIPQVLHQLQRCGGTDSTLLVGITHCGVVVSFHQHLPAPYQGGKVLERPPETNVLNQGENAVQVSLGHLASKQPLPPLHVQQLSAVTASGLSEGQEEPALSEM